MLECPYESYWPRIKALAEVEDYSQIENLISSVVDIKERISLYRFTVRGLMFRDWSKKNLTPIIRLGDLAIDTALKSGEIEEANIICYNMSSNLAGCWDDGFQRTYGDFTKGLIYAEKSLQLRRELKKGPGPFFLAYWAKGIHQFYLEDLAGAECSFNLCLQAAMDVASVEDSDIRISKETTFNVLLATGYLSLAQLAQGHTEAKMIYEKVISAFEEMKLLSADAKADAEIGLYQLRHVYKRSS